MKRLLFSLLLFTLFIPQSVSAAYDFTSPNQPLRITFDEEWRQFTDAGILALPMKEQENLQTAFFTIDKKNYLYVKRYPNSNPNAQSFQTAKLYYQSTPKELFKEERVKKPIETLIGKNIQSFDYDFEKSTLSFESEKTRSGPTSFKTFGFWKHYADTSVELQFVTYDLSEENKENIQQIIRNLAFDNRAASNVIPKENPEKSFQGLAKNESTLDKILAFVLTETFLFAFIGVSVFVLLLVCLFRFISRN